MAHFSSLWDLHISQAFDAPSSNLELCDLVSPPHCRRSYSLTLQRDALYYHYSWNCKLVRRSYCAVWAAVWWKWGLLFRWWYGI